VFRITKTEKKVLKKIQSKSEVKRKRKRREREREEKRREEIFVFRCFTQIYDVFLLLFVAMQLFTNGKSLTELSALT